MRLAVLVLTSLVSGCAFADPGEEYINVSDKHWVTGVNVQTYDRRLGDLGPIVPTDSMTREFRLGVNGITRFELGTCAPDPCQPFIEIVNPPVRLELALDTTVTVNGSDLPAGVDLAEPLGLSVLNDLTRRDVLVGPRGPGVRLDSEGVAIPSGTRTVRVRWFTEGDAEMFADSTVVEWRPLEG